MPVPVDPKKKPPLDSPTNWRRPKTACLKSSLGPGRSLNVVVTRVSAAARSPLNSNVPFNNVAESVVNTMAACDASGAVSKPTAANAANFRDVFTVIFSLRTMVVLPDQIPQPTPARQ